MQEQLHKSN
ncbi:Protein of unknown function [Lactobacillus helveticus CIRM-BIA 951]|uniref:Uncharacterized protein n=1 Tax=Lactobacillus helveticus CIRM-BIA 951 TaxID=1226334 RepID=U6F7W3_LACHE|nr:Protein of unknown function [Lactobacillus helveticus CIRM-BIA 951]